MGLCLLYLPGLEHLGAFIHKFHSLIPVEISLSCE